MPDWAMDRVQDYLVESREVRQWALEDAAFCRTIRDIAEAAAGNKLLLAGNGGSAGDDSIMTAPRRRRWR